MKVVKRTDEYTIYQKRSSRYAVRRADAKYINGDEKAAILVEHGLVEVSVAKPKEPEAGADEAGEATAESAADAGDDAAEATAEAE